MNSSSRLTGRTARFAGAAILAFAACFAAASSAQGPRAVGLPTEISDQEFWGLTDQLSEPNGYFRSDNFLSNEMGYQWVIPDLVGRIKPGGVYLGVGPEQNFPYIAALKPRMAFILDIRRGNLHEQLLYKALFEMSADRADFLSRLFSRERPAGLTKESSVSDLFAAYDTVRTSDDLYKKNLKDVLDWLTRKHQFKLSDDDVKGVEYVYHDAFYMGGPYLTYSMGRAGGGGGMATYQQLMLTTDRTGENRGFLAAESTFAYLKDLESRNLIVPVVGNFGGPKAIRAIGKYVSGHGGTVVAFYLSNVEQFLVQDGIWGNFCSSVATLPLDDTSTYIYTGRGSPMGSGGGFSNGFGGAGGLQQTNLRPMLAETKSCPAAR